MREGLPQVRQELTRPGALLALMLSPALLGCPVILESEHNDRVDADGDGFLAVGYNDGDDCDDANASVNPGTTEVCGDGLDNDCSGGANNCGLSGTISVSSADYLIVPASGGSKIGYGVANAGDVDGDGTEDLLAGAPGYDNSFPQTGGAYLFQGEPSGALRLSVSDADLKVFGYNEDEQIGTVLAAAGDMDGDGLGDILLGAPLLANGGDDKAGAWYVVLGPGGPAMSTSAAWGGGEGEAGGDRLGSGVSSGDLNGDGVLDVAAGAPYANQDGADAGHVYVHFGPVQGSKVPSRADVDITGVAGDLAGSAVLVRDFDGDGIADLLTGTPGYDGDGDGAGGAFLVSGPLGADGLLSTAYDAKLTGLAAGDGAGATLASGDLNDDGYLDAVVGAPDAEGVSSNAGAALVLLGPLQGAMAPGAGAMGQTEGDSAGASVDVGDANGDGVDDLVVGAPTRAVSAIDTGAAYLLYGPVDALIALGRANVKVAGEAESDYLGTSVALVDWDGNGSSDLVLGAWGQDQGGDVNNGGLIYVFMAAGL